jgi:hypothetical protein
VALLCVLVLAGVVPTDGQSTESSSDYSNQESQQQVNNDASTESATRESRPGAIQWALAVILAALLIGGLIRVAHVLRGMDALALMRSAPQGMRSVECGSCHTLQYVGTHGRIFMCYGCHAANRLPIDPPRGEQTELIAPTGPLKRYEFRKGGENFWQELKQEDVEEGFIIPEPSFAVVIGRRATDDSEIQSNASGSTTEGIPGIPHCIVCLDSAGSMVMLPCAHGGVCQICATRIAQNRASGGARCPHCRAAIQRLVKIHEVSGDTAKGVEHRIPIARPV